MSWSLAPLAPPGLADCPTGSDSRSSARPTLTAPPSPQWSAKGAKLAAKRGATCQVGRPRAFSEQSGAERSICAPTKLSIIVLLLGVKLPPPEWQPEPRGGLIFDSVHLRRPTGASRPPLAAPFRRPSARLPARTPLGMIIKHSRRIGQLSGSANNRGRAASRGFRWLQFSQRKHRRQLAATTTGAGDHYPWSRGSGGSLCYHQLALQKPQKARRFGAN